MIRVQSASAREFADIHPRTRRVSARRGLSPTGRETPARAVTDAPAAAESADEFPRTQLKRRWCLGRTVRPGAVGARYERCIRCRRNAIPRTSRVDLQAGASNDE